MHSLKKVLHQKIAENEALFDFVQGTAPQGLCFELLSPAAPQWCSAKLRHVLGYEAGEEELWHIEQYILQEDWQNWREQLQAFFPTIPTSIYQQKLRFIHRQGHTLWLLCQSMCIYNAEGQVEGYLHTYSTAQEGNFQTLDKTQELLEQAARMARVGAFEVDMLRDIHHWSAVTREIHEVPEDFTPDMEQGLAFYKEGESREKIIRLVEKALQTGEGFDDEFQIITAKGQERWVRVIAKTEFEDGQCVRLYGTFQDIDQRKRAEEALKESEQRFRNLFDTIATVAVQGYNAEGKTLYWNKASEHFYGYSAEEAIGKSLLELIVPQEAHTAVKQDMAETFATGKPIPARELLLRRKNGTMISVFSSHAYVEIPGRGAEMYCLDVDITPLKEVSEALRIQKERFDLMIHATKEGIFDWDIQAQKVYRSPAWKAMLGYQEEELPDTLGIFEKLLYIEDRQRIIQAMDSLLQAEGPQEEAIEARMYHKSGSLRWVAIKAVVIYNEAGQPIRMVGAHTDITQQKEAEEALRQSERLLAETGRAAMVGGWHIDFEKKSIFWSDITKAIHELPPDYVAPTDYEELLQERIAFYKEGYSRERIAEVIQRAQNEAMGFDEDLQIITAQGRERWVRVIGTPEIQEGRCTRIYGAFYDIDQQKRAEEKQKLLLHFTKLQNERLQNFAYIVSHNLRSHSANIQSLLGLLFDTHPELKDFELMQLLENSSEKLLETIEHLAQVAALDIDQQELQVIRLDNTVKAAISNVAALAKKSEVDIQNLLKGGERVLGIPAYLDSIVLNFLTNALKYRSTARKSYVRLYSRIEGEYLALYIEDNGLGIDLERNGKKLFGMYKTFHQHPEAKGVGLFITKNQVEAMGGKISVESHPGKGTRFVVYFQKAY
jgi:PAS domain S-box-containing protein